MPAKWKRPSRSEGVVRSIEKIVPSASDCNFLAASDGTGIHGVPERFKRVYWNEIGSKRLQKEKNENILIALHLTLPSRWDRDTTMNTKHALSTEDLASIRSDNVTRLDKKS